MNDHLKTLLGKLKNGKMLFILGIIGILLISLSSFSSKEKKGEIKENAKFNTDEYSENLEKKVKNIVSKITGSRDVSVLITLEGGVRYTYGQDSKETTENKENEETLESEQKYIFITDADGNEKALSLYETYPLIRGVTVVFKGNASYTQKIEEALSTALGITSKRISIINKGGN